MIGDTTFTGWIDPPTDIRPALGEDATCDVAVIGGGLGGMATALRLAERGIDVMLLEAEFCGYGASSRNAGQLAGGPGGDIQMLNLMYRKRMPGLVRYAENAGHFLEGLISRLEIDCDYEPTGNVGVAVSKGQMGRVRRVGKIVGEAGAQIRIGTRAELGIPHGFLGGLLEPVGGILNPGKLTRAVRAELLTSTARLFEGTPVQKVEPAADHIKITVPGARVRTQKVVMATNAYGGSLDIIPKRLIIPIWIHEVETEPIDPERLAALGWTSRAGIVTQHAVMENYRLTSRNTIVFGVRRLQRGKFPLRNHSADGSVVDDLVDGFRTRFPPLADVQPARAWGGWIAVTPTWLPVAGLVADNVYYSIPCNGHGLAQAPYVGTMLADLIAGDVMPQDLSAIWRRKPKFGPSPAMTRPMLNLIYAYDRSADRVNGSRRHAERGQAALFAGTPRR